MSNQPQTNSNKPGANTTAPPVQQPAKVINTTTGVAGAGATNQQDPNNIDLEKFIADSSQEVKKGEEKETERKRKTDLLTKAIESRTKIETLIFNNSETDEFVGTKMQYGKDSDGKTIYDYINDPEVCEHIQFVVPEDDPKDGSPVTEQITFFWIKPSF